MNEQTPSAEHFERLAPQWNAWKRRNRYYHRSLERLMQFLVEPNRSVLELGCATGDLLNAVHPSTGVGVDSSSGMAAVARQQYPQLTFLNADVQSFRLNKHFDYVLASDLIGHVEDIQQTFRNAHRVMTPRSRLIVTYYNFLWEPVLVLAEWMRLKIPQPKQNWINTADLFNLLELADFEVIRTGQRMLIPKNIPVISWLVNTFLAPLPMLRTLCVARYVVARPKAIQAHTQYSVSLIVPARNEKGNIESVVQRVPKFGKSVEIVFVEGNSTDGTLEEIRRVAKKYRRTHDIKVAAQEGAGKGDAVRKGFAMARGEVLMILDADLTVPPEELPKFYDAIASNRGEFINGSRLVYPMEDEAMRFLNLLGNKFFSIAFTWLLGQRFKDTLCGTKVLFKADYERIARNRSYFGEFDPFGDFDLIFGAAKLNLKILELPIRYKERTYGSTNISRFRHGLLLLRMTFFAMRKMKFIS